MEDSKEELKQVKRRGRPKKQPVEEVVEEKTQVQDKSKKTKEVKTKKTTTKTKETTKESKENEKKEENRLTIKKEPKEVVINQEELKEIEQEIKKQTNISEDRKKKITKKLFENIVLAITIIIYFIFINLGYYNINETKYLVDLKVFSIITIGITIVLFEKAYKKDSGYITIYGIEMLVLSILTLLTTYFYVAYKNKFPYIMNVVSILYGIYYVGKCIVIYVRMKKDALKRTNDIHKITK